MPVYRRSYTSDVMDEKDYGNTTEEAPPAKPTTTDSQEEPMGGSRVRDVPKKESNMSEEEEGAGGADEMDTKEAMQSLWDSLDDEERAFLAKIASEYPSEDRPANSDLVDDGR